jgi:hypothetical protein
MNVDNLGWHVASAFTAADARGAGATFLDASDRISRQPVARYSALVWMATFAKRFLQDTTFRWADDSFARRASLVRSSLS